VPEQPSARDGQDAARPDDTDRPGAAVPAAAGPDDAERGRRRRRLVLGVALVAALAVVAGVSAAVVSSGPAGRPSAGGAPGDAPGSLGQGGQGGQASPEHGGRHGAAPGGNATRIFVTGRVSAVSASAITIAGDGPPVTAAVTGSTRVFGRVSGVAGIRTGDKVAAQITERAGRATVATLRDPAALPAPGNIP